MQQCCRHFAEPRAAAQSIALSNLQALSDSIIDLAENRPEAPPKRNLSIQARHTIRSPSCHPRVVNALQIGCNFGFAAAISAIEIQHLKQMKKVNHRQRPIFQFSGQSSVRGQDNALISFGQSYNAAIRKPEGLKTGGIYNGERGNVSLDTLAYIADKV